MNKKGVTAIVLAAGNGSRMKMTEKKQYYPIKNKPLMVYSLIAFEQSTVDEIIVMVSPGDEEYVRQNIVEKYDITKVTKILAGGNERYDTVENGLKEAMGEYVLIHDGARPFISNAIIEEVIECIKANDAAIVAVPVKDTIKDLTEDGVVNKSIDRSSLVAVQTPQGYKKELLLHAYKELRLDEKKGKKVKVTDDAGIMEQYSDVMIHVVQGDYHNIKITTREDIGYAEFILNMTKHGA